MLRFGVGLYQPDKEKNDATYRPLAEHLSRQLARPVKLCTVDTWEGLAGGAHQEAADSVVFWTSDPLPNDAVAVRAELARDAGFVARLRGALATVGAELGRRPELLPPRYTGFVAKDEAFYRPIRDAGLATGKLSVR